MTPVLDLRACDPCLHDQTRAAFAAGDARGFVIAAKSNMTALALVFDNLGALRGRGIYEAALLEALVGPRTNHHRWSLEVLYMLVTAADRDRLRAAGAPLPPGDPVRLYRGVAGWGRARRIRGLHWTTDYEQAVWFAGRFGLHDPAVYVGDVPAHAIVAAIADRQEAECLVLVPPDLPITRVGQARCVAAHEGA